MRSTYHTCSKAVFCLFGALFVLSSCKRKDDTEVIKAMEESLINSNRAIGISNQWILMSMRDKTGNPATKEKAMVWFPVSEQIQTYSSDITDFINQLKNKKQITNDQSKKLYKKLMDYKNNVLNVNSSIKKEFEHNITIITRQFDSLNLKEADFTKTFFTNKSPNSLNAVLTKLQNNISTVENKLLIFCHSMTAQHIIIDDFPSAFISQNSTIFKQGDEIKITAGVGSLKRLPEEEISIGGIMMPIQETGLAVYKLKAKGIGIHSLPVMIGYINADGKKEMQELLVEYTVTKPCDQ